MVSLADLIDRNYYVPETDPIVARFALLSRAAELGHLGGQFAVQRERVKFQQQLEFQQQQNHDADALGEMFGNIIGGMVRHR